MGSLVGRGAEVVEMMEQRKVDLAGLQEVGHKGNGMRTLRGEKEDFKVFWCGGEGWWRSRYCDKKKFV